MNHKRAFPIADRTLHVVDASITVSVQPVVVGWRSNGRACIRYDVGGWRERFALDVGVGSSCTACKDRLKGLYRTCLKCFFVEKTL